MDATIAKTFSEQVCSMIDEDQDRERVYDLLRAYHDDHDIGRFVADLKKLLCDPRRLPLFDDIRFLIPPRHQMAYDRLLPKSDADDVRIVRLTRHRNESLGFSVRGGLEHQVGVYVSDVEPESQAYEQGLRVGDEIVRLNGFTVSQAIHQEVLSLIKARRELVLKVRHVGLIPVKDQPTDKICWKYVDIGGSTDDLITDGRGGRQFTGEEVHLYINVPVNGALGCSICSGPPHLPGVFIQSLTRGGLADEAGLEVGDQIVRVNDVTLEGVRHSEAIVAFKSSKHLDLVIRKGVGVALFKPSDDREVKAAEETGLLSRVSDKDNKEHINKLKSSVEKSGGNWKQEDLLQQVINVIDSCGSQFSSANNAKLKAAIEVIGQNSDSRHQSNCQHVKAEVHSSTDSVGNSLRDVRHVPHVQNEKQPRLYDQHTEPVYSEIEEVTSPRQQPISTGLQQTSTNQPPFPEASTDFRASPSYETTIISTEPSQAAARVTAPVTPQPNTVWSSAVRTDAVDDKNAIAQAAGEEPSEPTRKQAKQFNPKIYRPIEIQSFHNQVPIRPAKSPTSYMTEERKPNFRIQKPVLLHQTYSKSEETTKLPATDVNKPYFDEVTFNPNRLFTNEQIDGRQVNLININKKGCSDLGIVIETSRDRVIVGEVYENGAIQKQGGVHVGDQIMMVDGHSLVGVPVEQAYRLLKEEFKSSKPVLQLVVAKAPPSAFGSEVLPRPDYMDIPISNLDDFTDDDVEICMYNNDIPVTII